MQKKVWRCTLWCAQDSPFAFSLARIRRTFCVTALLVLACLSYGGRAVAQSTTYRYTGKPLGPYLMDNRISCPPVCAINGSFTVAQPLAKSLPFGPISPLAFTFSDGNTIIEDSSPFNLQAQFSVATDANGVIVAWRIVLNEDPLVRRTAHPATILLYVPSTHCFYSIYMQILRLRMDF